MTNTHKVSVIVPVYNVESFLEQCVESIIAQTHTKLQIILVDDGSKDLSGVICDNFKLRDSRIEVIHKPNGGLSSARNAGLEIATGDYISFIDSDDFIAKDMYEQMITVLNATESDIVGCAISRYYYLENIYKPYIHYNYTENLTTFRQAELAKLHILCQIDCSVCNKLFKREFLGENRFKEGVTNEDFLFFYYLYKQIGKLTYLNIPLYFYRYTQGSISNSLNNKSFDIIDNALEIKKDIENNNISDLKLVCNRYLFAMCFAYCFAIRYKCNPGDFKKRYQQMFEILQNNLKDIYTNPFFSISRKYTIVVFVKFTFCFDIAYNCFNLVKKMSPIKRQQQVDQNKI